MGLGDVDGEEDGCAQILDGVEESLASTCCGRFRRYAKCISHVHPPQFAKGTSPSNLDQCENAWEREFPIGSTKFVNITRSLRK